MGLLVEMEHWELCCHPMDGSTPGFPVLHHLPELAQTHVHWVSDAIQVTSDVSDSVRLHWRQPTRLPRLWDSLGKNTGVGCHFLLQCMKVKSQSEVAQSCLTLRRYGLQHAKLRCLSPSPRACSNSCPLSQSCHPTISSSVVPFSFCPQSFHIRVSSYELALSSRWPKYWSFSVSPSDEYSGLISFRIDQFDLFAV